MATKKSNDSVALDKVLLNADNEGSSVMQIKISNARFKKISILEMFIGKSKEEFVSAVVDKAIDEVFSANKKNIDRFIEAYNKLE